MEKERNMGVFSRFMDIVNANINAMLDKAEDPEKTVRLMLQEMEDTLIELKSGCAGKMALLSQVRRSIEEEESMVARWLRRASLAIDKGREDLAREALVEKRAAQRRLEELQSRRLRLEEVLDEAKKDIMLLEDKLAAVKQKYRAILEEARRRKEAQRSRDAAREDRSEAMRRFREMEERIDRMAEEGRAGSRTTEERFRDLESDADIENELEAMKEAAGKPSDHK